MYFITYSSTATSVHRVPTSCGYLKFWYLPQWTLQSWILPQVSVQYVYSECICGCYINTSFTTRPSLSLTKWYFQQIKPLYLSSALMNKVKIYSTSLLWWAVVIRSHRYRTGYLRTLSQASPHCVRHRRVLAPPSADTRVYPGFTYSTDPQAMGRNPLDYRASISLPSAEHLSLRD